MRIGVDDGGSSSDTLQPDRLPHHQQFTVRRALASVDTGGRATRSSRRGCGRTRAGRDGAGRIDNDQVARWRFVDRSLDRCPAGSLRELEPCRRP